MLDLTPTCHEFPAPRTQTHLLIFAPSNLGPSLIQPLLNLEQLQGHGQAPDWEARTPPVTIISS